jgi:photosystem II stability/assembly factor-like uncharacterized protein
MLSRLSTSRAALCALAVAGVALAGCSSSTAGTASTGSSTPGSTSAATPTATPTAPASTSTASPAPTSVASTPPTGPAGGPVPAGFTPTSASFISASAGWVLGTAPCATQPCTSIVRTRDGGRSWQGIPAPKATLGQPDQPSNGDVAQLRFADASDGWAGVGALYSTHNGGTSWTAVPIGAHGSAVSAIASGGGYVYVAVYGCPSEGSSSCVQTSRIYVSPIGSDHFSAVAPTIPGSIGPADLAVHGADWFVLAAKNGVEYHGHGNASAVQFSGPCTSGSGAGIAAADAQHLDVLCAGDGAAGTASYQLNGTSNGGEHWLANGPPHLLPTGLAAVSDSGKGVLLVAAESGASRLYRSTNDGTTLPIVFDAGGGGTVWSDAGFTTSTQAVAVLQNTAMYLSRDSAATWVKVVF